jgi:hypothetical protein
MALNYTVYQYDGSRNAVVMTDMEGKQLVIDCDKAEEKDFPKSCDERYLK